MDLFDVYRNLTVDKLRLPDASIDSELEKIPMNWLMSMDIETLPFAVEMNSCIFDVPKVPFYLFWFHLIPKRGRQKFLDIKKQAVKSVDENLIEKARILLPEYTREKILEVWHLIEEEVKDRKIQLGGLKNDTI